MPRYFFSYLKNRFFGNWLIPSLEPLTAARRDDVEIRVLCQKKDLWMLVWSLRSFLFYSQIQPHIFVHDDGSLDQESAKLLEAKFPGLMVITQKMADEFIAAQSNISDQVRGFRNNGHKLIYKLVDIFLMSQAEKVIVLDSDILFFNKPTELIEFINKTRPDLDALISRHDGDYDLKLTKSYIEKYNLAAKGTSHMNSGLIIFKRAKLHTQNLNEYFENTLRATSDYFVEMTGWASLISQLSFKFLPPERYKIKGPPDENTVMKHFTSPRRYELYAYGIDMIRSAITTKKSA